MLTGPEAVLASVKTSGKKALLAELASRAASVMGLDERRLFDRLVEREALGSTGVGGGIAEDVARPFLIRRAKMASDGDGAVGRAANDVVAGPRKIFRVVVDARKLAARRIRP